MNRTSPTKSPNWFNKVPEVTLFFWLIKMMSTTVGETAADFLNAICTLVCRGPPS